VIPLRASLPKGYRPGRDGLKVFATVGTTNFRWLELPALDQPPARDLKPAAVPGKEWVAAQVELNIRQA
jgi:hypothetical protein